ncbi:histone RNA hairpin-binding protein isoform X2 [Plodia interpunctella]|uniref:histone RNA hairpin-binding protein isoform X2 n=1 Tax=Plodia interpunctella TaxID=58824 RepID=UPI002367DAFA|nr:histone RNA hairpin-binding protein isoform X2 [Plodia interpunctella]
MNWATESERSLEDELTVKADPVVSSDVPNAIPSTMKLIVKNRQRIDAQEKSKSRKRPRPNSKSEAEKKPRPPRKPLELETDMSVLGRRQKQIDYGKNTVGYHNYTTKVPLDQRTKDHPKTPDKYTKYSRRSWDTLIKLWRKQLHEYDDSADKTNNSENFKSEFDDESESSID